MKKVLFLSTLIAAVLFASSCQKEQELVTLGAVISQPSKTYIDDRYPCWNNGDQVYVNNAAYPISAASGPSAQIADVVSADSYRAIFPAHLVTPSSNITNSASIPITLPSAQHYTLVDGHQRVEAPMGAYITSGTTLQFYNLCSIVRVVVNNATGSDLSVGSIILKTDNACLSGAGIATIDGSDASIISINGTASHSVSLRFPTDNPVTVGQTPTSFDIVVPSFSTDNVNITLNTTDGKYFELTKNNVALVHNTVTTVTLSITSLTDIVAAELVNGSSFRRAIPDNASSVVFEYNSNVSSGTILSTDESPVAIYGNLDGTTWRLTTSAQMIYANQDCDNMFGSEYSDNYSLYEIIFGDGFNTINVKSMREMFSNCMVLSTLDVSTFNTSNVENMRQMFGFCRCLTRLDVSNLNTSKVTNMYGMFIGCSGLTDLDVSGFNTEKVTAMPYMFLGCSNLTRLDVSNFNTSKVRNMSAMFSGCNRLTSLDVSNFNTENVSSMVSMFSGCSGLTQLDLSQFNTSKVTNMQYMFRDCTHLTSLILSNFDMSHLTTHATYPDHTYLYYIYPSGKYRICRNLATSIQHCTITCPSVIQTELENGDTELPTSGVTFTWVRP